MIRERGDMWSIFGHTDVFLFTGNSYIRKDGALVMGRGIAKQVATRFPEVPYDLGKQIDHLKEYNVLLADKHYNEKTNIGVLQVKYHFADAADLALVEESLIILKMWTEEYDENVRFDINYPAIGYGRRSIEIIEPMVEELPNNVHVWTYN